VFNTIFELKAPAVFKAKNAKDFPVGPDAALLYGVELEIENISFSKEDACVPGIMWHEDGSLRNNGCEYVTKPMDYQSLGSVLTNFFNTNKFTANNYSERCSVHVHCNIGDMPLDQIQTLLIVYSVFERVLFEWIGDERKNNIFCVPLYETNLTQKLFSGGSMNHEITKLRNWQKYTALNMLPMFTQSTVEFRHMAGEHDVTRIMTWCALLGQMFKYAKTVPQQDVLDRIVMLNNNSLYGVFLQEVFGSYSLLLQACPNFRQALEEGVVDAKFMITKEALAKNPKVEAKKPVETMPPELIQQFAGFNGFFDRRPDGEARIEEPVNYEAIRAMLNANEALGTGVAQQRMENAQVRMRNARPAQAPRPNNVFIDEPGNGGF